MRFMKNFPVNADINALRMLYRITLSGMKIKSSDKGISAKIRIAIDPYLLNNFTRTSIFFLYRSMMTFLPPTPNKYHDNSPIVELMLATTAILTGSKAQLPLFFSA